MQDFEDFVALRSQSLLRTAYLLCGGDRGAAEDILQDVLMGMYGKWRRIKTSPEAYARASIANAAANRWRRRARKPEAPFEHAETPVTAGHEQRVVNSETVVRALAQLPKKMRAVLVLRFFDDLSEADTARALGCGVGTVKSQTSRGLARMRELMGEQVLTWS
ncbi:RNA polymerase sigma-70 factor, sigma-E family [Lentzea fradiae]|uniref:RNA polymerase sigma-70 factor, sigma-E family n=1 Tax=Lentzea fradiae TaxID=200378 RepID=A0A1G7QIM8_9PSEU|nr:SigE family RNA polymerase sigma factor [Lentzea fradiae]SDF98373.1 RNA polymerase sigma-70 factor, sigma-E family [Lentzea fradiae]